jgi:hypothetical protein
MTMARNCLVKLSSEERQLIIKAREELAKGGLKKLPEPMVKEILENYMQGRDAYAFGAIIGICAKLTIWYLSVEANR